MAGHRRPVTVLSGGLSTVNLLRDLSSRNVLANRGRDAGADDQRTMVHLLADQIGFAEVVALTKITDAGPECVDAARKIIRAQNAAARIVEADLSNGLARVMLDTGLFDCTRAREHPIRDKDRTATQRGRRCAL